MSTDRDPPSADRPEKPAAPRAVSDGDRLGAALRENLRRRKEQARRRAGESAVDGAAAAGEGDDPPTS